MEIQIGDSIMRYKNANYPGKSFCTFKCGRLCHKKTHIKDNLLNYLYLNHKNF